MRLTISTLLDEGAASALSETQLPRIKARLEVGLSEVLMANFHSLGDGARAGVEIVETAGGPATI